MSGATGNTVDGKRLSATEIRKLSPDERSVILSHLAAEAEHLYRGDPQLTDFEAFGEEDLHGEPPIAESR